MTAVILLVSTLLTTGEPEPDSADMLRLVQAANRQNKESIRSIQLTMFFEPAPGEDYTGPSRVDWWQTESSIRAVVQLPDATWEYLHTPGKSKCLQTNPRKNGPPFRAGSIGPRDELEIFSPWLHGLIMTPKRDQFLLDAIVGEYGSPKITVEKSGRYRAEFLPDQDGDVREMYLEPKKGCLTTHIKTISKKGKSDSRHVLDSVEPKPGIFFPSRVENRDGDRTTLTIHFLSIRINEPIATSVFTLNFPEGTSVSDQFTKQQFVSDRNEGPANTPSLMSEPTREEFETKYPTDHPLRRGFWTRNWKRLAAAAGAVVLIAVGVVWRRGRRREEGV